MDIRILLEGLSPVLFFFTKNDSAYNIAKTGYIDLGLASRNSYEVNLSNGMFFLSTTRSRVGGFHKDKIGGTLFTLNGNKMRQKYSGRPIDYFHKSAIMPNEMEDRIVTNHSKMPLLEYITRADVHWSAEAKAIYVILRKKNIPVYVYENQKDWLLGNTKKAMTHKEIVSQPARASIKKDSISISNEETQVFNAIFELYNAKEYDDITNETRNKIKVIISDDGRELSRILNNVGINWRKRDHFSDQLNKLTRIFKREKVSNSKEFAAVLRDKLDKLSKKEQDKKDKADLIKSIRKFDNMINAIEDGEDPLESASKYVHDEIDEYPIVLKNLLSRLFKNVNKFYTKNLERHIKGMFPVLKNEDFSIEDKYENSIIRAEIVLRNLGVDI